MALFVDEVECTVEAGQGGHGVVAFLREKYRPNGGPCGGDGGRGGSIILKVDSNLHTLLDIRYNSRYKAKRGAHGQGSNKTGKGGPDIEIRVPPGTEVWNMDTGFLMGDLTDPDASLVVAKGGRGGRGNQHFANSRQQAPQSAENGQPGEKRKLRLTLKLMADVGLVGFPNAGKSTLLAALSKARPKIADYPFTTLEPGLGIVPTGEYSSMVMADIPGLIEGASHGKGLGYQFLRHIERTRVLLYMIDATEEDPQKAFETLRNELATHSQTLADKPFLVALTKADAFPPDEEPEALSSMTPRPHFISSHSRRGIDAMIRELWGHVTREREAEEQEL